ncbi:hypothetical protein L1887_16937 [Cichorium endivia]|nr:hypothetical protein L1887_16937 [Cichorium endivia]
MNEEGNKNRSNIVNRVSGSESFPLFSLDVFLLCSGVRLLLVLFLGFAQCEKDFSFPPLKAIWVSTFTSKF